MTKGDVMAEVERLRAQLDAYLNDPSQVVRDLREECDLVAGQRDWLAEEVERLREAITTALRFTHIYTFATPDEDGNVYRGEKVEQILRDALDA